MMPRIMSDLRTVITLLAATVKTCHWPNFELFISRRIRQVCRSLGKYIAPSVKRADVRVAKPKFIIEGFAAIGSLRPQQSSYYSRIAPNTHFLVAIFLTLIDHAPTARFFQQISFCVCFAKTCY